MAIVKWVPILGKSKKEHERLKADIIKKVMLEGDAHVGSWHRQVNFLAEESIETTHKKLLARDIAYILIK